MDAFYTLIWLCHCLELKWKRCHHVLQWKRRTNLSQNDWATLKSSEWFCMRTWGTHSWSSYSLMALLNSCCDWQQWTPVRLKVRAFLRTLYSEVIWFPDPVILSLLLLDKLSNNLKFTLKYLKLYFWLGSIFFPVNAEMWPHLISYFNVMNKDLHSNYHNIIPSFLTGKNKNKGSIINLVPLLRKLRKN